MQLQIQVKTRGGKPNLNFSVWGYISHKRLGTAVLE